MPKTYVTGGDKLDTDPYNGFEDAMIKQPLPEQPGWWQRKSRRAKLLFLTVPLTLIALAIGLGVGLGLGLNHGGGDVDSNGGNPDTTDMPIPSKPTGKDRIWQPQLGESWQIVLQSPLNLSTNATSVEPMDVGIYDIDLFTNSQDVIDTLHRLGKKVICYFSAGSYEPNRPDSQLFKEQDKGKGLVGWPGERWLNLTSPNVRRIMKARMELAAQKQCDAVDPDNVDAYANKNGIGMTMKDSVDFLAYLSGIAGSLRLAIGLKNAGQIVSQVLPGLQFAVNEQCVQYSECGQWTPFITAGKPVFHIEYPSEVKLDFVSNFCNDTGPGAGSQNFSTVIKHMSLDGYVLYCNGQTYTTLLNTTGS